MAETRPLPGFNESHRDVPVVDLMQWAARDNRCDYEQYSQMVHLGKHGIAADDAGGTGICYGLGLTWLATKRWLGDTDDFIKNLDKKGVDAGVAKGKVKMKYGPSNDLIVPQDRVYGGKIITTNTIQTPAKPGKVRSVFELSHWYYSEQQGLGRSPPSFKAQTGLEKAPADARGNPVEFVCHRADLDPRNAQMEAFAEWISSSVSTRYCMIECRLKGGSDAEHAMAAYGSRLGKIYFFDPNGGIVSTRFRSRLANFLRQYFNDNRGNLKVKEAYRSSTNRPEGKRNAVELRCTAYEASGFG